MCGKSLAAAVGMTLILGAATAAAETYNPRADLMRRYPEMAALRKEARPQLAELQRLLSAAEASL